MYVRADETTEYKLRFCGDAINRSSSQTRIQEKQYTAVYYYYGGYLEKNTVIN